MKQWPEDKTATLYYEDLVTPVRKAFLKAYKLVSRRKKNVPYEGYNFGGFSLAGSPPPDEHLQEEMIKYHRERGRDILDIILMIAFNLGIEQGRRLEAKNSETYKLLYESYRKMYESTQKDS